MNRIQPQPPALQPPVASTPNIKLPSDAALAAAFEISPISQPATCAPYALFAPLHYEANYAYPLIVWLHGPGESEAELKRIMPRVSLRNYVAIAPRAAATVAAADDAGAAAFDWLQTDEQIQAADERVLECVERAARRFNIAPDRCFLAGRNSGGTMAWRIALRHPRRFAGVISLSGPLPSGGAPLAQLEAIRRLSVFVGCSRDSQSYPSESVCDDLRLLHTAGMSIVLRAYPGAECLTAAMLSDMDRWIMDQIAGCGAESMVSSR